MSSPNTTPLVHITLGDLVPIEETGERPPRLAIAANLTGSAERDFMASEPIEFNTVDIATHKGIVTELEYTIVDPEDPTRSIPISLKLGGDCDSWPSQLDQVEDIRELTDLLAALEDLQAKLAIRPLLRPRIEQFLNQLGEIA
jgi:predicted component of type VI protein secretion system